jgi:hypothetical protein
MEDGRILPGLSESRRAEAKPKPNLTLQQAISG